MKKVLIYVVHEDYMAYEEAVEKSNEGYDVYFVTCDCSVGICGFHNPYGCRSICKLCNNSMKAHIVALCKCDPKRYHCVTVSSLVTSEMKRKANAMVFDYKDTQSLKDYEYKGVEIGYGAFSTFVTVTRNVMPTYNDSLKNYLDYLMKSEVILTEALMKYVEKLQPDLIVYHNGRMSNYKPIRCIAKNLGIEYIATERIIKNGVCFENNFINDIPHSFEAMTQKMELIWERSGDKKYTVAKNFFENRYHARPAGDKVYVKDQILGELPEGFDPSKRNISIFNSSEDEYCSISKDFDNACLYPNQYVALKTIFEHYKDNHDIHFYLRIHPNLADVPYRSHTALYGLKYDNVTIIPPKSSISSYTLMENSEKVIVFNSTMGMESSYWGKAVIALNRCFYYKQDIVYQPKDEESLFNMIDNPSLPHIERPIENWYKPAFYCMGNQATSLKYFPCREKKYIVPFTNIAGHIITTQKLLGSNFLYMITYKCLKYLSMYGLGGKFSGKILEQTK